MDFGKIVTGQKVNFDLPPDHPDTAFVLKNIDPVSYLKPQFFVGTVIWTNKDWKGVYYPAGISDKEALPWYGKQFNTIELNTTHYQIPDGRTIIRWREAVKPGFKFCPKIPQTISHGLYLPQTPALTKAFCTSIAGLKENLGTCFLQLPEKFGLRDSNYLVKFLENFPAGDIPLAIELRNPDWFKNNQTSNNLFELLHKLNISPVITDVATRRDVLHQRLTTGTAFIRFNAYGATTTDFIRLDDWVKRLKEWFDLGLQRVYFMMHEENNIKIPLLTNYVIDRLAKICEVKLDKCLPIGPVQGNLF